MTYPQILIISDDAEFAREIVTRWDREPGAPLLTVVTHDVCLQARPMSCSVAIIGPVRRAAPFLPSGVFSSDVTVCAVASLPLIPSLREEHANWVIVPEQPCWPEGLLDIVREIVRRNSAEARAQAAELSGMALQRFASLGQSLVYARPGLVNALTSLLGNADLLMLSDHPFESQGSEQIKTIHRMALRLNETLLRLFSLAKEIELGESESQVETVETHAEKAG